MGQKHSTDGASPEGGEDVVGVLKTSGTSALKASKDTSTRSIHWAEQVATDMEQPSGGGSGAHSNKKLRVRTRSEEEEYERQLQSQERDELSMEARSAETDGEMYSFADDEEISEFEALLVQELKKRVRDQNRHQSPRVRNLNSILMKFPNIKEGFEQMRGVFDAVDSDGSGDIDFQEWCDAMREHGLTMDIPEEHQLNVWREADVDGNNLIDFKEFVVVMAFLYLMDYVALDEKESAQLTDSTRARRLHLHDKVRTSIDLVVDAFLFFDKDGDGRIKKEEVMRGLDTSYGVSGKKYGEGHISSGIWKKRFAEMDCDHSGSISLKEFIFAFENWVGFDESEDEEEE
uniref:EF-hand domain-containing protein n=1 Tax=Chloropicon laureae TaxID=464258 RepID=A0A7S2YWN7_9CHLO|mmetsp:Transcript_1552/g.3465  ORF Transcript_1552/g.3465 Transcript_1552/m.3465 type:complete len:346 (-) Transcript_1552:528-1565(-)|eukprot:CAMPEP_0197489886 /NCGR_PEP_ID=MMETSP1311-20131121/4577_1 /TAXON_ID=464262 /ORGANISM="Genus nov. species nov., Strain RCC856" /LENGTH=345 /DNA_ID=CAMNT_0043034297 /DNA_START=165 /DNA_END=1202 /DNA_ORIENTATION=-